jgi:hypothetical protein
MKKNPSSKDALLNPRVAVALLLCSAAALLAMFGFAAETRSGTTGSAAAPAESYQPVPSTVFYPATGHSFWNEIMVSISRSIPSFGEPIAFKAGLRMAGQSVTRTGSSSGPALTPLVSEAVAATVSPPVRDLPSVNPFSTSTGPHNEGELSNRTPQFPRNPLEQDPVIQRTTAPTVGMPPVGASFEGMENNQACNGCIPPDPNGAVGPNHYIQMVNEHFAVYDKSGAVVSAPKPINSLWSLTPNSECFQNNNGDPIVIYDQLADRWLLSQFVAAAAPKYAECIAVSTSPDPMGTYYLYEFDESAGTFHDYPHIGVWPDGYYMSTNLFPNNLTTVTSTGAGAWAFERPKMLLGQPARYIFFDETPLATQTYTPGGQLPTSLEGKVPPLAGAPNYFVEVDDTNTPDPPPATSLHDEMHIWKFHVDWTNPANSSFGVGSSAPATNSFPGQYAGSAGQPNFILPIADYVPVPCQFASGPTCIPEKVTPGQPTEYLEALGDRLMHRVTYRNFADHESLVVSHTAEGPADQSGGAARAGVRWYELRGLSTTPTVYQQSTFAPLNPTDLNGPLWRWMGSAAMDHVGDIAIGYSASGPNYFPSLHYAGRLASDPLNDLTQGEAVLFQGSGIQVAVPNYLQRNRWGDYSALQVDPADDCTFWYTNEYLATNGTVDVISTVEWHTRIGSFRFPQCFVEPPPFSVVSRMIHGSAGNFDINLPFFSPHGVEPRTSATLGAGNYTLVFTFPNTLVSVTAAAVTAHDPPSGTGSVCGTSIAPGLNQYIVNLCNVSNAQYITVTLFDVVDSAGNNGNVVSPQMGVLIGDVNGNGVVSNTDVSLVKAQVTAPVASSNFREDVNANGVISNTDVSVTKAQVGTTLPSPP